MLLNNNHWYEHNFQKQQALGVWIPRSKQSYKLLASRTSWNYIKYVSKKFGQTTVVIQYYSLSSFFWNRRYFLFPSFNKKALKSLLKPLYNYVRGKPKEILPKSQQFLASRNSNDPSLNKLSLKNWMKKTVSFECSTKNNFSPVCGGIHLSVIRQYWPNKDANARSSSWHLLAR